MTRQVVVRACVVAVMVVLLSSCGMDMAQYQKIHLSARQVLPIAVEMEELFGDANHSITHFGSRSEKSTNWHTDVYFGGRYKLSMQARIRVDYDANTFEVIGEPDFVLVETESVQILGDGRVAASFGRNVKFSKDEWKRVYEKNGDFAAIGIELNNEPVANFDSYAAGWRRDVIAVSLLGSE